jgi:hypothetical protein
MSNIGCQKVYWIPAAFETSNKDFIQSIRSEALCKTSTIVHVIPEKNHESFLFILRSIKTTLIK